ncbi:MAG: hypothetical protein HY907_20385 [Deltaproteobacteria bacterium]|nr:hypothetical protein [Deltaproteobacteria bacterium]
MGWWKREAEGGWLPAARGALRGLALGAPALLFLLVWYADGFRRPWRTTPIFVALGVLALVFGRRDTGSTDAAAPGGGFWARGADRWGLRLVALGALGLLWLLLSEFPYQGMIVYAVRTTGWQVAVGCVIAGLVLVAVRPPRPWVVLAALIAGDLTLRAYFAREWPVEPWVGDMLPLVQSACDRLLSGVDPYGVHQMQLGSQVPLTYPPGLWLAYLPARALGVDIRWTSWVADGVIAVALAWPSLRAAAARWGDGGEAGALLPAAAWPVLLSVAAYLFLIDTHWNGIYAEPHVDWAATALLGCAIATRRPMATGIALGFALAVRPLNLPLGPLVAVGLWRIYGLRRAAQAVLAGAAVTLAFYLPFVLWNPDTFFLGTVQWLFEYARVTADWYHGMMGFTGPLLQGGFGDWLQPLQLVVAIVGVGLAAWLVRTPRGLLAACAAVYGLIVAFNPLIWMSFWIGATIWVAAAVGCPADDRRHDLRAVGISRKGRKEERKGRKGEGEEEGREEGRGLRGVLGDTRVLIAGGVVVVGLGGWMGVLLARHFSTEGREEVRGALLARVRAGDLVIDRTGWRFAFLRTPWILEEREVPEGAWLGGGAYTGIVPRWMGIQPGPNARILAVDRYGLFEIDRPAFAGIYRVASEERFGAYRLTTLERAVGNRPIRLVDRLPLATVALERAGTRQSATWRDGPARWTFEGLESWQDVGVRACRYGGLDVGAVWAHPPDDGWLVVAMPIPLASRFVLVSGGLVDEAAEFGRSDVFVDVRVGSGRTLRRLTFANEPGRFGRSLALPSDHGGRVELGIGAPDNGRRHFCVDLTVW